MVRTETSDISAGLSFLSSRDLGHRETVLVEHNTVVWFEMRSVSLPRSLFCLDRQTGTYVNVQNPATGVSGGYGRNLAMKSNKSKNITECTTHTSAMKTKTIEQLYEIVCDGAQPNSIRLRAEAEANRRKDGFAARICFQRAEAEILDGFAAYEERREMHAALERGENPPMHGFGNPVLGAALEKYLRILGVS